MKRKSAIAFAAVLACSAVLTGCQESKGLETKDLKITQYKEVEVDQVEKPEEVTAEAVDEYIESILKVNAETVKVKDRAVEKGDTVNIDFVGKIDGKAFDGGSAEGYSLEIGSDAFIPGFEDSVIGHKIDETFDWNGSFPDDYGNKDYAGKDVVFTITVNSISRSNVPELTDEFVKSVSKESTNVEEYKKQIKKQLTEEAERNYDEQLNTAVWKKVLDNTEVSKYPKGESEKFAEDLIEQYHTIAEYQNMKYEDYLEQNGTTVEEFEKQVNETAKERVKQIMVLEAIADKEKLELTDEVYEKELEKIAEANGYEDVKALKEASKEDDLKDIALYNIVVEWLTEHCIQKAS